jgi:hypothetical protein
MAKNIKKCQNHCILLKSPALRSHLPPHPLKTILSPLFVAALPAFTMQRKTQVWLCTVPLKWDSVTRFFASGIFHE